MLFGLKNAPSVFQRLMNAVVADMTEYAAEYFNDPIIFNETFGDHIQHLRTVLLRLQETGLILKSGKCFLAGNSCCFLGHAVGEGQILLLEAKVKVVVDYSLPLKKKNMRAFLGLTNYYRRFVPSYGTIAIPLNDATRKVAPDWIEWTQERLQAYSSSSML